MIIFQGIFLIILAIEFFFKALQEKNELNTEVINNNAKVKINISLGKKKLNSASVNKQACILRIIAKNIPKFENYIIKFNEAYNTSNK